MSPDDPRHGTEAGYAAHRRDSEDACDDCYQGRLRADRRRRKLRTMGRSRRQTVGASLYEQVRSLSEQYSQSQVAAWAHITPSVINRIMRQGPSAQVDVCNKVKLARLLQTPVVTPIGYTRRMRALMAMGYTAPKIAAAVGLNRETVKLCLARPPALVKRESARKMLAAYDCLSMTLPSTVSRIDRAQATRARERARREGWLPPFAWDDIDNPDEQPTTSRDHSHYRAAELLAEWDHLRRSGESIEQAARQLGVTVGAIEKAIERAGRDAA